MTWLTILKYGLPCLIAAAIAFGSAWEIQGVRIGKLDNKVAELITETQKWDAAYKLCEKTNATNNETITELEGEVKKNNTRCDTQQGIADKTMLELAEIDALPSGNPQSRKEKNEDNISVVNDSVLAALNGMFFRAGKGSDAAGGDAVHQAADPTVAGAAAGISCEIPGRGPERLYYFDEVGAKNLLKNIAQERGRTQRIEALVEGLR